MPTARGQAQTGSFLRMYWHPSHGLSGPECSRTLTSHVPVDPLETDGVDLVVIAMGSTSAPVDGVDRRPDSSTKHACNVASSPDTSIDRIVCEVVGPIRMTRAVRDVLGDRDLSESSGPPRWLALRDLGVVVGRGPARAGRCMATYARYAASISLLSSASGSAGAVVVTDASDRELSSARVTTPHSHHPPAARAVKIATSPTICQVSRRASRSTTAARYAPAPLRFKRYRKIPTTRPM